MQEGGNPNTTKSIEVKSGRPFESVERTVETVSSRATLEKQPELPPRLLCVLSASAVISRLFRHHQRVRGFAFFTYLSSHSTISQSTWRTDSRAA
jgi:hypothetical protein